MNESINVEIDGKNVEINSEKLKEELAQKMSRVLSGKKIKPTVEVEPEFEESKDTEKKAKAFIKGVGNRMPKVEVDVEVKGTQDAEKAVKNLQQQYLELLETKRKLNNLVMSEDDLENVDYHEVDNPSMSTLEKDGFLKLIQDYYDKEKVERYLESLSESIDDFNKSEKSFLIGQWAENFTSEIKDKNLEEQLSIFDRIAKTYKRVPKDVKENFKNITDAYAEGFLDIQFVLEDGKKWSLSVIDSIGDTFDSWKGIRDKIVGIDFGKPYTTEGLQQELELDIIRFREKVNEFLEPIVNDVQDKLKQAFTLDDHMLTEFFKTLNTKWDYEDPFGSVAVDHVIETREKTLRQLAKEFSTMGAPKELVQTYNQLYEQISDADEFPTLQEALNKINSKAEELGVTFDDVSKKWVNIPDTKDETRELLSSEEAFKQYGEELEKIQQNSKIAKDELEKLFQIGKEHLEATSALDELSDALARNTEEIEKNKQAQELDEKAKNKRIHALEMSVTDKVKGKSKRWINTPEIADEEFENIIAELRELGASEKKIETLTNKFNDWKAALAPVADEIENVTQAEKVNNDIQDENQRETHETVDELEKQEKAVEQTTTALSAIQATERFNAYAKAIYMTVDAVKALFDGFKMLPSVLSNEAISDSLEEIATAVEKVENNIENTDVTSLVPKSKPKFANFFDQFDEYTKTIRNAFNEVELVIGLLKNPPVETTGEWIEESVEQLNKEAESAEKVEPAMKKAAKAKGKFKEANKEVAEQAPLSTKSITAETKAISELNKTIDEGKLLGTGHSWEVDSNGNVVSDGRTFSTRTHLGRTLKHRLVREYDEEGNPVLDDEGRQKFGVAYEQVSNYTEIVKAAVKATLDLSKAEHDLALEQEKSQPNSSNIAEYKLLVAEAKKRLDEAREAAKKFADETEEFYNDPDFNSKYIMEMFDQDVIADTVRGIAQANIKYNNAMDASSKKAQSAIDSVNKKLTDTFIKVENIQATYDTSVAPGVSKPVKDAQDLEELAEKRSSILAEILRLQNKSGDVTEEEFQRLKIMVAEYQRLAKAKKDSNNPTKKEMGGQELDVAIAQELANYDKLIAKSKKYGDATALITESLIAQKEALQKNADVETLYDSQSVRKKNLALLDQEIVKQKELNELIKQQIQDGKALGQERENIRDEDEKRKNNLLKEQESTYQKIYDIRAQIEKLKLDSDKTHTSEIAELERQLKQQKQLFAHQQNQLNGMDNTITAQKRLADLAEIRLKAEREIANIVGQIEARNKDKAVDASKKEAEDLNSAAERENESDINEIYRERERLLKEIYKLREQSVKFQNTYLDEDSAEDQADILKNKQKIAEATDRYLLLQQQIQGTVHERVEEEEYLLDLERQLQASLEATENSMQGRGLDQIQNGLSSYAKKLSAISGMPNSTKYTEQYVEQIKKLEAELAGVLSELEQMEANEIDALDPDKVEALSIKYDELSNKIEKALSGKAFSENKKAAESSLAKLRKSIEDIEARNTAMGRKFREQFDALKLRIDTAESNADIEKLKAEIVNLEAELIRTGNTGKSAFQKLREAISTANTQFLMRYFSLQDWLNYARQAFNTIEELDYALVDLKKTSAMSASELKDFYYDANDLAKSMGVTTKAIIEQASSWSRLGYSTKEASSQMAVLSSQFASISPGMGTEEAQLGLVSLMKAYKIETNEVERTLMDNINTLGNKFAETNQDIIEGMKRAGATLAAVGTSVEDSFALFTGAQEVIQNAETVGTALKTLSLRIRGYDEETEELSEDVIAATGKVADLTKVASNGYAGISLWKDAAQTEYKSLKDYLGEIAEIWDEIDAASQTELLDKLFGKRGASVGSAILGNFKQVEKSIEAMEDAAGAADAEMSIIEQSIDFKLNALRQTWVGVIQELIDNGMLGEAIDTLTRLSEVLGDIITTIGPLPSLISAIGLSLAVPRIDKIIGFIREITNPSSTENIGNIAYTVNSLSQLISDLYEAISKGELFGNGGKFELSYETLSEGAQKILDMKSAFEETITSIGGLKGALSSIHPAIYAIVGITAAVKIGKYFWDKYTVSVEEANEELSKVEDEVTSLRTEIEKLRDIDFRTEAEQARLDMLEEELALKEKILKLDKQIVAQETYGMKDYQDYFDPNNSYKKYLDEIREREGIDTRSVLSTLLGMAGIIKPITPLAEELKESIDILKKYREEANNSKDDLSKFEQASRKVSEQEAETKEKLSEVYSELLIYQEEYDKASDALKNDDLIPGSEAYNNALKVKEGYELLIKEDQELIKETEKLLGIFDYSSIIESTFEKVKFEGLKDELTTIAKQGRLSTDLLKDGFSELVNELDLAGVSADALLSYLLRLAGIVDVPNLANKIASQFTKKKYDDRGFEIDQTHFIEDYLNSLTEEKRQIAASLDVDFSAFDADEAIEYIQKKIDESDKTPVSVDVEISDAVTGINTRLKSQFDELGKAYSSIFNGDDGFDLSAVDNDMLKGIVDNFITSAVELGVAEDEAKKSANDFMRVLANQESTSDDVQKAFNELATTYFYAADGLKELNKDTADAIKQQLKQLNISNADAVVDAYIEYQLNPKTLYTVKNEAEAQMRKLEQGGSVDLMLRPVIDAKILNDVGWEAGEGVATVFSSTFSNEAGNIAINFTPIIADENGNFVDALEPEALEEYAEGVINGVHDDYLNLQIGAKFEGADAIQQASKAAEKIHELQDIYYNYDLILQDVNEENAQDIITRFKQVDAINAEEVVLSALNAKLEAQEKLSEAVQAATDDMSGKTENASLKFAQEAQMSNLAKVYLANLVAAQTIFNNQDLNVEDKITALSNLANAYLGAAAQASFLNQVNNTAAGGKGAVSPEVAWQNVINEYSKLDFEQLKFEVPKTEDAAKGGKEAADAWVEAYEKELQKLDDLKAQGLISEKEYLNRLKALIDKYFKDRAKYAEKYAQEMQKYLDKMLEHYNSVISGVTTLLDKRINKLNKNKDSIVKTLQEEQKAAEESIQARIDAIQDELDAIDDQKEALDEQIDGINEEIDKYNDMIDAINEANDARQREINLSKALYELQRAQNQRTKLVYTGEKSQMRYERDESAVRDAKEQVKQAEDEITIANIEKQIKLLEDEIELIEKQKKALEDREKILSKEQEALQNQLESTTKYYEKLIEQQEKLYDDQVEALEKIKEQWEELAAVDEIAKAWGLVEDEMTKMGYTVEDVLNGNEAAFNAFKEKYVALLKEMHSRDEGYLNGLKETTKEVPGQYEKIAKAAADAKQPIEELGTTSETASSGVSSLGSSASSASSDVGELSSKAESLTKNVTTLSQTDLTGLKDALKDIVAHLKDIDGVDVTDLVQSLKDMDDYVDDGLVIKVSDLADALIAIGEVILTSIVADLEKMKNLADDTTTANYEKIADSIGEMSTYSVGSLIGEFTSLQSLISPIATALTGENGLVSALKELQDIKLDSTVIAQFNALKDAINAVTNATNGSGAGQQLETETGKEKEESASHLVGAIEEVKQATTENIGVDSEETGDTAIGHFNALGQTIETVAKDKIGISDEEGNNENPETLIGTIDGLKDTVDIKIPEVISQFDAFKSKISECIQEVEILIEKLNSIHLPVVGSANDDQSSIVVVDSQDYTGTAIVKRAPKLKGSAKFTGDWGVKRNETSLVGELGTELVVDSRNGTFRTVGDKGPELTKLHKGDLVYNHKQTQAILSKRNQVKKKKGPAHMDGTLPTGFFKLTESVSYSKIQGKIRDYGVPTLEGIRNAFESQTAAIRNEIQQIAGSSANRITNVTQHNTFNVNGVSGEDVARQINNTLVNTFTGMSVNAYQRALT